MPRRGPIRTLLPAVVLAAGLLASAAPRAAADTVNLTFDSTTAAAAVTVTYNAGAGSQTTSTTPGPYYWHPTGGPLNSQFPATTVGFCVELTQPISVGGAYTYEVKTVEQAVGAAKAAQFAKLWGAHYNPAWASSGFTGTVASTAFQLALWELVYDGPSNLNLAANNFKVPGANLSNTSTAAGLAKSWLDGLAAQPASVFDTKYGGQRLVWLSSASAQDQLAMIPAFVPPNPVPGPAGAMLGLVGVGMCWAARRRRA